jgi:hypothetical protein
MSGFPKHGKIQWVAFGAIMLLVLLAVLLFVLLVLSDATHSSSLEQLAGS